MNTIRILAVDDSETFLRGIESLLALEPDMQLVGKTYCGSTALDKALSLKPDIVLADLRLSWQRQGESPTHDAGLRTIRAISRSLPETRIIVLSSSSERRRVVQAIDAGAQGYLPKEASANAIITALRVAAHGGVVLTSEQLSWLRGPVDPLTPREQEVLAMLAEGSSDAEIGRRLGIATRTASKHVENIREKLGGGSRWEAVIEARRRGLLS